MNRLAGPRCVCCGYLAVALWTLAIMGCSVRSAHAEPLRIPQTVFAVGVAGDALSTCRAFAGGAHESNPLMPNNCAALASTKGAVGAMVLVATAKLAEHKPLLARVMLYVGAGVSVAVAVHNVREVRR